jgi:hypothetical protein
LANDLTRNEILFDYQDNRSLRLSVIRFAVHKGVFRLEDISKITSILKVESGDMEQ